MVELSVKDLVGNTATPTAPLTDALKSEPVKAITTDISQLNNGLQELTKFADTINNILDKIENFRGKRGGNAGQQNNFPLNGSPASIHSSVNHQTPPQPQQTQTEVVYKMKPLNRIKIKELISDLLINQATKLPNEIKDKKISEITGQEFLNFKYETVVFDQKIFVDSEQALNLITEQLCKAIERLHEGE